MGVTATIFPEEDPITKRPMPDRIAPARSGGGLNAGKAVNFYLNPKKWQVVIGRQVRIRFWNFVCLTFHARPSHRLAIVTAAENHFLAANDNHDIANRRILITPDRNFRWSVFAGHRNLPESISRLDDTGRLVRLLAAKTEFKTIASKIIQHPAVTIERIKLRRRVIELSVQTTIEGR